MKRAVWVSVVLVALLLGGFTPKAHAQGFEIGAQVAVQKLPELGETKAGYGFRFTYGAYMPFLAVDSEINFFPTSSTGNLGETQAFIGLRAGVHVGRWGVYAKARPGFEHFGGGGFPQRLTSPTHFALDLGGVIEYDVVPLVALRLDLSDVLTDFGDARLLDGPGFVGAPLHTQHNFQTTIGAVVRF